ncbi:MAG: ankyrin repeat domain-containing protein [Trueperaceae bacterium]
MRVLSFVGVLLALGFASAQVELFGIIRDGSLAEVVVALDGQSGLTRLVDEYEQDLLMYAAAGTSDPLVIRYLVSTHGFDVNRMTSQRWTPLMFAVRLNPEPLIAQALIELGAVVGTANVSGERAVDMIGLNPNPAYGSHPVARLLTSVQPLVSPTAPLAPSQPAPPSQPTQSGCCRVCRTGKACGDSCISRNNNCNRGRGCACQGVAPLNPLFIREVRAVASFDAGEVAVGGCDFTQIALGGRYGATVL